MLDLVGADGTPIIGCVDLNKWPSESSQQLLRVQHLVPFHERHSALEKWLTNHIASVVPLPLQKQLRRHYTLLDAGPALAVRMMGEHAPRGEEHSYGSSPCHRLDIYHSSSSSSSIVLFVHGGAWSSGSKSLYCLLGHRVAHAGCTCCVVGYRLMKAGEDATIAMQADDISRAVQWARQHFGRTRRILLAGHSSGAHICMMALLNHAAAVDGVIGLSGPYNIRDHFEFEKSRGLHEFSPMGMAAGGVEYADGAAGTPEGGSDAFDRSSPTYIAATRLSKAQAASLPPILLIHGRRDTTVPVTSSVAYGRALKAAGAPDVAIHLLGDGGHFDLPLGFSLPLAWQKRLLPAAAEAFDALMAMAKGPTASPRPTSRL